MDDRVRVWISSRKCKKRTSYHLRWLDATRGKMRSKCTGTDRKHAEREAARLEDQLSQGTYREARKITWAAFVDDHVSKIEGPGDAVEARRTLDEFGVFANPASPRSVT